MKDKRSPAEYFRRFTSALGPGIITGAADDDPSGVATYSIAGAQFNTGFLWTALLSWPLMAPVQMMCARIGMVTGGGLARALAQKFPRSLVIVAIVALLLANTINVGSDLAGMADAAAMLTGVNSRYFVILFAGAITWAAIRLRYVQIARTLMWLALVLFAYVIAGFQVTQHWSQIIHAAFIPSLPKGKAAWATLVAILGTTISPYLFFWQASQEVEHEKASGRNTIEKRRGATADEIIDRKFDVGLGTFFSNVVMFFIILTTASTLNRHGITQLQSSRQVAEALKPLAGEFAYLLYTVGLLGVGFLAIPTLTGSAAYAFAETFHWHHGLDEKLEKAQAFYGVMLLSTLAAVALDFLHVNPVQALYWTAVVNGVLAPFLLVGILVIASDARIMQGQPSSLLGKTMVGIAATIMFAAAIVMFITA